MLCNWYYSNTPGNYITVTCYIMVSLTMLVCACKKTFHLCALLTGLQSFLRLAYNAWIFLLVRVCRSTRNIWCWYVYLLVQLHVHSQLLWLSCSIINCCTAMPWHFTILSTLIAGVAPSLAATNSDSALDLVLIDCLVDIAWIAPFPNVIKTPVCPL